MTGRRRRRSGTEARLQGPGSQRLRGLGELERAIMEFIWEREQPTTGREVVDWIVLARPVAYTTVLTVMDRLVAKGMLIREQESRANTYAAVVTREAYTAQLMATVLGTAQDPGPVLLHFIEQISPASARALTQALKRRAAAEEPRP